MTSDLQCRYEGRPCAAAAAHPLRGEYCKLQRGEYLLNRLENRSRRLLLNTRFDLKGGSAEEFSAQPDTAARVDYWHTHCASKFSPNSLQMLCRFRRKWWCVATGAALHVANCGSSFCTWRPTGGKSKASRARARGRGARGRGRTRLARCAG